MAAQVLKHLSICRASDCARELFGRHQCDGQAVEHRKLLAAIVPIPVRWQVAGQDDE
jgi:hypothetical protein